MRLSPSHLDKTKQTFVGDWVPTDTYRARTKQKDKTFWCESWIDWDLSKEKPSLLRIPRTNGVSAPIGPSRNSVVRRPLISLGTSLSGAPGPSSGPSVVGPPIKRGSTKTRLPRKEGYD